MTPTCFQLFVYGSLRSGFHNPAYEYLTRYFHLIGDAIVRGRLYDNGSYPVAVATADEHYINGELYQLNDPSEFEWAIEQLDDYEGLNVEEGETTVYKRDLTDVFHSGKQSVAWVYWYNQSVDDMPAIETGDILKYLQEKNKP
jgi:gamma-glutamylcyclotransferase (GGCT)/AIG2-like uncharacterized protein YtfP